MTIKKDMKKFLKYLISILVAFSIFIPSLSTYAAWNNNAVDFVNKNGERNALYEDESFWFGQWGTSNGTIKYRIIGWQISVKVKGKNYVVYSRVGDSTKVVDERFEYPGSNKLYTLWKIDYNTIVNKLKASNPSVDFSELADRTVGSTYKFDAIMTTGIVRNGVIYNQGDIDDNGNRTSGTVYYDLSGILGAASWTGTAPNDIARLFDIGTTVPGIQKPPVNEEYTPNNGNLEVKKYDYKESNTVYWVKPNNEFQVYTDGYLDKGSHVYPERNILNLFPNGTNSDYGAFATTTSGSTTANFNSQFKLNTGSTRGWNEQSSSYNYLKSNFYLSANEDNKNYLLNYLSQWKGMNGPYTNSGVWIKTDGTAPIIDNAQIKRTDESMTISVNNMKDNNRSGNKQISFVIYEIKYKDDASKHTTISQNVSTEGANISQILNKNNLFNYDEYKDYTIEVWTKDNVGNTQIKSTLTSKGKRKNYITVEHRDIDNNNLIEKNQVEGNKYNSVDAIIEKSYSAQSIYMYDYKKTTIIEGGIQVTTNGGNPAKIKSRAEGENKIIFYYKKKGNEGSGDGLITFNPHNTEWTNKSKISEGKGSYPIQVEYTGSDIIYEGMAVIIHNEPLPEIRSLAGVSATQSNLSYEYYVYFDVIYSLNGINVTGSANKYINGKSGTINIDKEGASLQLFAEGKWSEAKYIEPIINQYETIKSISIPKAPSNPKSTSGYYNLDWTRSEIKVTEPKKEWIKQPVPYYVSIDINDNLSGLENNEKIVITDSSHYNNSAEKIIDGNKTNYLTTVGLTDGIYKINIKADDIAGNEHSETYETYYIDGNSPKVDFNISNKLFSEENGAIRKKSSLGSGDSYYGKLTTSDNLSGLKTIEYKWTYGNSKPSDGYINIYTSNITFNDRYEEEIIKDIEKPVGDNLYLHVQVFDVAGNYTYKCYGPYEDPIKLKDFEITDIRDPRWTSVFWQDNDYKNHTGKTFKVNELAIDDKSNPIYQNLIPNKGYAFYFNLTSEYLYREQDRIEIKPTFHYIKDGERIRVDCYYDNNNNPVVGFGTPLDDSTINLNTLKYGDVLIGNYNKLILTRGVRIANGKDWFGGWKDSVQYQNGKEQWWYGKYFIPSSTFSVKSGNEPTPENKLTGGNLLINFEIIAYKNGAETFSTSQIFNYNSAQWEKEGGPIENYKVGDVIIYDGKYGIRSDINSRVIH